MNREEYLKIEKEFNDKIRALETELITIKKKYIKDNCPVEVGDNVSLYGTRGQIVSIKIDYSGGFCGTWKKYKKDGSLGCYKFFLDTPDFKDLVKEG